MSRLLAIGDVHGCLLELEDLIKLINPSNDDHFIFIGDLIHKGPYSKEVISFVRDLSKTFKVTLIGGNHEEKHIRWYLNPDRRHLMSYCQEYEQIDLSEEDINYLLSGVAYLKINDYLFVHAGIPPLLSFLPKENNFMSKSCIPLQRIRFVDKQGNLSSIFSCNGNPDFSFWAKDYDGRFGHVIFGHQPFFQSSPFHFSFATGIDTGCAYGYWLSCLSIDLKENTFHSYSSAAKETYYKRSD